MVAVEAWGLSSVVASLCKAGPESQLVPTCRETQTMLRYFFY